MLHHTYYGPYTYAQVDDSSYCKDNYSTCTFDDSFQICGYPGGRSSRALLPRTRSREACIYGALGARHLWRASVAGPCGLTMVYDRAVVSCW